MTPNELTLFEVSQALEKGELSSVEVTTACLKRIDAVQDALAPFISVDAEGALLEARASDARRRAGQARGPLDGVPVALKDNIVAKGLATTAGSKLLAGTTTPGDLSLGAVKGRGKTPQGFVAPQDSTVMRRLREAGAPLLGKTNLDEFGMGSSTENSGFGPTRNPWDPARTPGGSSGGSAAAVAARACFSALGTDTGGSIRQPAALTGVVGLKPTWGRVSRNGVVAFASSLDQVGPLTRSVRDAAMVLQVIAGADAMDSTSADKPVQDWTAGLEDGVKGLRVGLPREYFVAGMDPEVERAVRDAAKTLERLGATVREVSLPHSQVALAAYYVIATSEASSNLGRYDGVRYGHRAEGAKGLRELYAQSRAEGFGPEVKRRILLGTFALSAGYHDAYYVKAQRVRTLIRRDFETAFADVDVLLSATSPVPAWPLGEKLDDPLSMYLMDVLTIPCNLAGLPGLSVPVELTTSGLPIGVQLLGRPWDEATVLRVGRALEREAKIERAPGRA